MRLPLLPNHGGVVLRLSQVDGIVGGTIWPSAAHLCQHLLDGYYHRCHGHGGVAGLSSWNVLELGSGTGAVGLFAAGLGIFRSVHLTELCPPLAAAIPSVPYRPDGDLDWEMLEHGWTDEQRRGTPRRSDRLLTLLAENVALNAAAMASEENPSWPPSIHELDWTVPDHASRVLASILPGCRGGFDLLLASDVTYATDLHDALAATISRLLSRPDPSAASGHDAGGPKCLLAHHRRVLDLRGDDYQWKNFERALLREGLAVATVHDVKATGTPGYFSSQDATKSDVSIVEIHHIGIEGQG